MINNILEGWQKKQLSEFKYIKGKSNPEYCYGDFVYLTPEYLRDGLEPVFVDIFPKAILTNEIDSILLWDGSNAGEVFRSKKGILASTMVKFEINQNIISPNYFYYYLKLQQEKIKSETRGSGIPHVDKSTLSKINIIYPINLKEQNKIIEILQCVDNILAETKEFIKKFKNIKQGLMQDFFEGRNNKKVPLGSIVTFEYGTGLLDRDRTGDGYPVYGSNGIIGYHKEFIVDQKGIIIGRKGTAGSVNFSSKPFWPIDTTYYVKLKKKNNFKFFYYYLDFIDLKKLEASTGVPGLNRNDAYNLLIYDIPTAEQEIISAILSNLDYLIDIEKNYFIKIKNIKSGLMFDLLTGKVRVKID